LKPDPRQARSTRSAISLVGHYKEYAILPPQMRLFTESELRMSADHERDLLESAQRECWDRRRKPVQREEQIHWASEVWQGGRRVG
jgi:hypothetical protein